MSLLRLLGVVLLLLVGFGLLVTFSPGTIADFKRFFPRFNPFVIDLTENIPDIKLALSTTSRPQPSSRLVKAAIQRENQTETVIIYLPAGYNPAATVRYPAIYLLTDVPGRATDWIARGGGEAAATLDQAMESGAIAPAIAVFISGEASRSSSAFLENTLVPYIDAQLLTLSDPSARAIGGVGEGAALAIETGLKGNAFQSVLSLSAPEASLDYISSLSRRNTRLALIVGGTDGRLDYNKRLYSMLESYGFKAELKQYAGSRSWPWWRKHLPEALKWLGEQPPFLSTNTPASQPTPTPVNFQVL